MSSKIRACSHIEVLHGKTLEHSSQEYDEKAYCAILLDNSKNVHNDPIVVCLEPV